MADIAHLAYIKLCTIARALNNDPDFPRFTKDEYRYTPWFYLYNQKEIDEMDEEDRNQLVLWGVLRITVRLAASLGRTRMTIGRSRVRLSALALL